MIEGGNGSSRTEVVALDCLAGILDEQGIATNVVITNPADLMPGKNPIFLDRGSRFGSPSLAVSVWVQVYPRGESETDAMQRTPTKGHGSGWESNAKQPHWRLRIADFIGNSGGKSGRMGAGMT